MFVLATLTYCNHKHVRLRHQVTPWRNGSASDSRSEGCVFESRRGHEMTFFEFIWTKIELNAISNYFSLLLFSPRISDGNYAATIFICQWWKNDSFLPFSYSFPTVVHSTVYCSTVYHTDDERQWVSHCGVISSRTQPDKIILLY